MRLYLIRHPQPLVAAGICYGRTDVAVSCAESARVAAALTSQLPPGVPVMTSPARRCTGLADRLAGGPASCDERLLEMDFGEWEMRAWDDIARLEIDAWADDLIGYRPGGGETVLEVARRVRAFYDAMSQDAIVVCHAGSIRLLLACQQGLGLEGMALEAARAPHRIAYGAVTILDCPDG